ncbi:MAG: exo-alpha-sialidase [Clostridia bacterium]|nr:exo-alpha-sialidase [Clostridia bacterium]
MKKIIAFLLSSVYSFLSLFGLSFFDGKTVWTKDLTFTVDTASDIFCPSENVWVNGAQYPSVIELSDGTLLATFEVFDKGQTGFRIMKSFDKGSSWEQLTFVTETIDNSLYAAWNPFLFQLSEDVGNFTKGTVILAGVSIDPEQSRKSQIEIFASTDGGESFKEISIIDEAGGAGDGVWEPFIAYENGYIYCFYSDDSDEEKSQTIVYKKSRDLLNWEEKKAVVKSHDNSHRPGMPVLTKMGNGKWFICYEFGNGSGYPIYCKTADSLESWDASDTGTQIITKINKDVNSAPNCIWMPVGGENGTLIVSGKYGNSKGNDLFLSSDFGKTFHRMKNPLDYSDKQGFGYHASFFYSEIDGSLYYANTVDYTEILSKISFEKLTIKER